MTCNMGSAHQQGRCERDEENLAEHGGGEQGTCCESCLVARRGGCEPVYMCGVDLCRSHEVRTSGPIAREPSSVMKQARKRRCMRGVLISAEIASYLAARVGVTLMWSFNRALARIASSREVLSPRV